VFFWRFSENAPQLRELEEYLQKKGFNPQNIEGYLQKIGPNPQKIAP
jgi:hypothetical protein